MRKSAILLMAALALGLVGGSTANAAEGYWYETPTHAIECGDEAPMYRMAKCYYVGQVIQFETGCSEDATSIFEHICQGLAPVVEPEETEEQPEIETNDDLDWSIGVHGGGLWAKGGPSAYYVEGQGSLLLRITDAIRGVVSVGPGYASYDGEDLFSISEFAGIQFDTFAWLKTTVGARHRVFLDGSKDRLQAVKLEVQAVLVPSENFQIIINGGLGWARFSDEEPVPGLYPAGVERPMQSTNTDALAGGVGLTFSYLFR